MTFQRLLIANRGEVAIRIARAAAETGLAPVMLYAQDDAASLHVKAAEEAAALAGAAAAAYLDIAAVVAAAKKAGCDAIHPGYGFLSESAAFARACAQAGLAFVGPSPEALELFGDKARARDLARSLSVPTLAGTGAGASKAELTAFFHDLPPGGAMILKAVAGGGGRGMRIIRSLDELDAAHASAAREAQAAFGDGALYAERLIEQARHVEVQVAGDGRRAVVLGDRDCSLQRRHQKIVEIAPAPALDEALRERLHDCARRMAEAVGYRSIGTFEFLVDLEGGDFTFIEANARLQVEHTITEEVTGLDLVQLQFALAQGQTLDELALTAPPTPSGFAVQARVNLETLAADGTPLPSGGRIDAYEPPSGPGVRVDGYGYAGYVTSPNYDTLIAKVVARAPTLDQATRRAERALAEFRIEGVETNIPLLRALLRQPETIHGEATTRFIEARAGALLAQAESLPARRLESGEAAAAVATETVEGAEAVCAGLQATVAALEVAEGDLVRPGQTVAILEAMKMEHVVQASVGGRVVKVSAEPGEVVGKGQPLVFVTPEAVDVTEGADETAVDLDHMRPDLAEAYERWRITSDAARPDAVARRRKTQSRTARENIEDLVDPGTFLEYGAFALAAQRRRRSEEELLKMSPADGLVCGVGQVNGALFGAESARCAALAYDYTVFAGTQGAMNHKKTDRMLQVVHEEKLPLVFFAEGGGGRPGDTEGGGAALSVPTFTEYARLAGLVPKISVVNGFCFAGNASIAGMSEILIATERTNIGMAGPAMIEGGGLGVFHPTQIGPVAEQAALGVVDVMARDEADATRLAKQALSYFQGRLSDWSADDQRTLRQAVPENRLRVYDVRPIIETLFDAGSFLELRAQFAPGLIAGLARLEGRPVGVLANDPKHLGGAVDCDGADKASRMFQLCDAFGLPIVTLLDTPGFMVGPESERQAAVRKTSRMFINGANLRVPMFGVVLRKAYGLGAMAMVGGSLDDPMFTVAWPTGEFGGMGLEGAVRLAYRKELEAETDPARQKALFNELVGKMYAQGKAIQQAAMLQVDAVIDPAHTRQWLAQGLAAAGARRDRGRRIVDAW
ncbi:MAG: carboxyl transferase domain-containing protein [Phenylobacterium sp.]|uniref:acetyl-CoA carboxylase family protein n=1 Tax=Phenylobacterium sp. TaxID=1871053 RepID=UPI0039193A64